MAAYDIKKGIKAGGGKYTTISIPFPLAQKVREAIEGTGFTSMSDYVTFILREVLCEIDGEKTSSHKAGRHASESRESIVRRLRALGYVK